MEGCAPRLRVSHLLLAVAAASGCSDHVLGPASREPPGSLLVSGLIADSSAEPGERELHAFASLPAGSVPRGVSATLRNRRRGAVQRAAIVDGAVDPVRMPGEEGDTLELTATDSAGNARDFVGFLKREGVPPVVVRSEPAQGVTDAPMLLRIEVVFSEPLDPATVNDTTIQVLLRDQPIDGNVTLSEGGTVAALTPRDTLAPGTVYEILVRGVRDLSGQPLAGEYRADFTTLKPLGADISFVSVTAGRSFTCALSSAGAVYCWGRGDEGQLGLAGETDHHRPTRVGMPEPATELHAANHGACVLTESRRVLCWGSVALLPDSLVSDLPVPVFGDTEMLHAAAGGERLCGISREKEVLCYGSWEFYDGGSGGRIAYVTPQPGPWFRDSALGAVALGQTHDCYLTTAGTGYCLGENVYGALGDAAWDAADTALFRVHPVAGGFSFQAITSGYDHSCALAGGRAYCWGLNAEHTVGAGSDPAYNVPTPVDGTLQFTTISAGARHTCGLTPDGAAWCWGDNHVGQLGDGTRNQRLGPVQVSGGLRFRSVEGGLDHTCGVTVEGAVYCWGSNDAGQLGDGSTTLALTPVRIALFP